MQLNIDKYLDSLRYRKGAGDYWHSERWHSSDQLLDIFIQKQWRSRYVIFYSNPVVLTREQNILVSLLLGATVILLLLTFTSSNPLQYNLSKFWLSLLIFFPNNYLSVNYFIFNDKISFIVITLIASSVQIPGLLIISLRHCRFHDNSILSSLDHGSLPPEFESRRGHVWTLFRHLLIFITFGGRSAHLAYLVHKRGRKTWIIIIIIIIIIINVSSAICFC